MNEMHNSWQLNTVKPVRRITVCQADDIHFFRQGNFNTGII